MKSLKSYIFESLVSEKNLDALPTKVLPLRKIDKDDAKNAVDGGHKPGELKKPEVKGQVTSISVNKLKAAQNEIIPEKAIGMAIGMMLSKNPIKVGGDLGSIISKDGYIMDGHHRWAATFLVDPGAKVQATQIDLNGIPLVSALNIITKGKFNREGNQGKGNIKDFTSKVIGKHLDDFIENGIGGEFPISKEDIRKYLGRVPGAKGDYQVGRAIMMKNADSLPKVIMKGAPKRLDMPVIGPDEVKKVKRMLADGEIDFAKVS